MEAREFENVVLEQLDKCQKMLGIKATEYASPRDMLHNFVIAAQVQGCSPRDALGGFMAKHTVSIYDLIREAAVDMPMEMWDEKITDHINYLLLLRAIIVEEKKNAGERRAPLVDAPLAV
jgi:hypothetical protein